MKGYFFLFLFGCLSILGFGQSGPDLVLDSIEIEAGVPQTTDFSPAFRVITDESDTEGRPLRVTVYSYDMAGDAQPLRQETYQYEDGQLINLRIFIWEASAEDWSVAREEIYSYENGLLISFLRKMLKNQQLVNDRLWSHQYDLNDNETELLLQEWDANLADWLFLSRKTTTYHQNGNIESQILQQYQGNNWNNRVRRMWNYEGDSLQPVSTVIQRWSAMDNEWVNQTRTVYSMGANGLWSGLIIEDWDTDSLAWLSSYRQTTVRGDQSEEIRQRLEIWQGDWVNETRNIYQYTDGVSRARVQKWDQDSMSWLDQLRFFARYEQNLPTEKLGMQVWSAPENQWENRAFTRRVKYYYKENQTTSTNEQLVKLNCWFPNPYRPGMTFNCDLSERQVDYHLQVYNSLGQLVHRQKINPGEDHIDALLYPGIYITHISQAGKILDVRKLIVIE